MLTFGDLFKQPNVEHHFSVPIYVANIQQPALDQVQKEFDSVYQDLVSQNKFQHHPVSRSHMLSDITFGSNLLEEYNTDFFKSQLDFHLREYLDIVQSSVPVDYRITSSWMTLNQENSYAVIHSHGDTDISGVYYFKTTGLDGDFFFETPNKLIKSSYCFKHLKTQSVHKPAVGKIILFPGWLEHGVTTNQTADERVSVSFNIDFKRF